MTWFDDPDEMAREDVHLQRIVRALASRLCPRARRRLETVHVYPSRSCTYTLDKRRVFVCCRDARGDRLPDCAVEWVLMHELAHVLNARSVGHDAPFQRTLDRLTTRCLKRPAEGGGPCAARVPGDYNRTCLSPGPR